MAEAVVLHIKPVCMFVMCMLIFTSTCTSNTLTGWVYMVLYSYRSGRPHTSKHVFFSSRLLLPVLQRKLGVVVTSGSCSCYSDGAASNSGSVFMKQRSFLGWQCVLRSGPSE